MMKKSISEVEIRIDNADFENLDNVEKALRDTVMTRIRPCRVIIDMTSLRVGFGVLKKTNSMNRIFEQYRDDADRIIDSTTVLVSSRPAAFVARIVTKLARPSKPVQVKFMKIV